MTRDMTGVFAIDGGSKHKIPCASFTCYVIHRDFMSETWGTIVFITVSFSHFMVDFRTTRGSRLNLMTSCGMGNLWEQKSKDTLMLQPCDELFRLPMIFAAAPEIHGFLAV